MSQNVTVTPFFFFQIRPGHLKLLFCARWETKKKKKEEMGWGGKTRLSESYVGRYVETGAATGRHQYLVLQVNKYRLEQIWKGQKEFLGWSDTMTIIIKSGSMNSKNAGEWTKTPSWEALFSVCYRNQQIAPSSQWRGAATDRSFDAGKRAAFKNFQLSKLD